MLKRAGPVEVETLTAKRKKDGRGLSSCRAQPLSPRATEIPRRTSLSYEVPGDADEIG